MDKKYSNIMDIYTKDLFVEHNDWDKMRIINIWKRTFGKPSFCLKDLSNWPYHVEYKYPENFPTEKRLNAFISLDVTDSRLRDFRYLFDKIIEYNLELKEISWTYKNRERDVFHGVVSGFMVDDIKYFVEVHMWLNDWSREEFISETEALEKALWVDIHYIPWPISMKKMRDLSMNSHEQ